MLLSKCALCGGKKLRFIKEQEASGILSTLGKKNIFNSTSYVGSLLF